MAPLTPYWHQPSHPKIQKVITTSTSTTEFTTKSISLITVPPFGVYAKLSSPPCTAADAPTYATVQMGKNKHFNLNSDLVYINHSCEPSVLVDTSSLAIIAGPSGLKEGQELTFFYPSTEWEMAQGFTCICSTPSCQGFISGAKTMAAEKLEGYWLNAHIRALLEERNEIELVKRNDGEYGNGVVNETANGNGNGNGTSNGTSNRKANGHTHEHQYAEIGPSPVQKGALRQNSVGSRELSGEMGGDTTFSL